MRHKNTMMTHSQATTPVVKRPRSRFNRNHTHKSTFDTGYLIPIFHDFVLPGDTHSLSVNSLLRLSTPLHPFMDELYIDTFFFFVPNRLVWDNWEKQQGSQEDPGDSTDFLVPQIVSPVGGYANQSVYDYFGLPTQVAGISHSALPFRALNLIYNEWFRDQNLQDSLEVLKGDSADPHTTYSLQKRGKRHDYFTACLPFPQKGPDVTLPLGSSAPVVGTNEAITMRKTGSSSDYRTLGWNNSNGVAFDSSFTNTSTGNIFFGLESVTGLETDLSDATSATINSIREAFTIQKAFELDARGGTRYNEILKSRWGVEGGDSRLQRPEYLGGGHSPFYTHSIPQTSGTGTGSDTPQGHLGAYSAGSTEGHGFTKSFVEHGTIIGLMCIRADLTYQKGLERQWSNRERFDFYEPVFAHLGEQAVLNKEIYAQGTSADDDAFGYMPRWDELRYKPSQITGKFRSNDAQSLDPWHLSQDFASLPLLNSTFIEENPPVERIVAVTTEPQIIADMRFRYISTRVMPTFSIPGGLDRL